MKKITLSLALLAGIFGLAGCGTTAGSMSGNTSAGTAGAGSALTSTAGGLLGNLLSGVLGGGTKLSQRDIVGTWTYQGSDCVFESENFLMQAGGEVAAAKIEEQMNNSLAKIGIRQGVCSFTFNSDNTYTANIGGRAISGNYSLDAANNKITMTYLGGIGRMTPHIARKGNKISLLIESDKLLTLAKGISALSSGTTMKTVSTLLSSYNGMLVGLQLAK